MNKLKQLSISLVLLSCFAVTSKVGAMNSWGDFAEAINKKQREDELDVVKNIARVSREGVQEKDMPWIIGAIQYNRLSIDDLQNLIKFGLKKYVNYVDNLLDTTCLKRAIDSRNLEIIKLLVSIGAKIDENTVKKADLALEFCKVHNISGKMKREYREIKCFLLEEKEKQENAEKEKAKMGKNLLLQRSGRTSDVRIHFQDN